MYLKLGGCIAGDLSKCSVMFKADKGVHQGLLSDPLLFTFIFQLRTAKYAFMLMIPPFFFATRASINQTPHISQWMPLNVPKPKQNLPYILIMLQPGGTWSSKTCVEHAFKTIKVQLKQNLFSCLYQISNMCY